MQHYPREMYIHAPVHHDREKINIKLERKIKSYSRKDGKFFHFAVGVVSSQSAEPQLTGSEKGMKGIPRCLVIRFLDLAQQSPGSESTVAVLLQDANYDD